MIINLSSRFVCICVMTTVLMNLVTVQIIQKKKGSEFWFFAHIGLERVNFHIDKMLNVYRCQCHILPSA